MFFWRGAGGGGGGGGALARYMQTFPESRGKLLTLKAGTRCQSAELNTILSKHSKKVPHFCYISAT